MPAGHCNALETLNYIRVLRDSFPVKKSNQNCSQQEDDVSIQM